MNSARTGLGVGGAAVKRTRYTQGCRQRRLLALSFLGDVHSMHLAACVRVSCTANRRRKLMEKLGVRVPSGVSTGCLHVSACILAKAKACQSLPV